MNRSATLRTGIKQSSKNGKSLPRLGPHLGDNEIPADRRIHRYDTAHPTFLQVVKEPGASPRQRAGHPDVPGTRWLGAQALSSRMASIPTANRPPASSNAVTKACAAVGSIGGLPAA